MFGLPWFSKPKQQATIDLTPLNVKAYTQVEPYRWDNKQTPTREEALEYVPFARAVGLISNKVAELISTSVRVVDQDNKEVKTEAAKRAIEMLRVSPNGVQSAREFLRECMFDYLVLGNALVLVERSMFGRDRLISLTRMDASSARVLVGNHDMGLRGLVYDLEPVGFHNTMQYPYSKIVHARFIPFAEYYYQSKAKQFMSESPLRLLKKPILIGKYADGWVADFFNTASKSNMAIKMQQKMSPENQQKQIDAYGESLKNSRHPLVLYEGAEVVELNPNPQDSDALALREYGVREIGRAYGLPAPMLGVDQAEWGSGIEELAKLGYRYGIKPHLETMLDAFGLRMLPMGNKFEIDPIHELKGDIASQVSMVETIMPTNNGPAVGSVEEARELMGLKGPMVDDWPRHSVDGDRKDEPPDDMDEQQTE